jgi:hypothetical protein
MRMTRKKKLGRPALPLEEKRPLVWQVRLFPEEHEALMKMAKERGKPASELFRACLQRTTKITGE